MGPLDWLSVWAYNRGMIGESNIVVHKEWEVIDYAPLARYTRFWYHPKLTTEGIMAKIKDPETTAINNKIKLLKMANGFEFESMRATIAKNKDRAAVYGNAADAIRAVVDFNDGKPVKK